MGRTLRLIPFLLAGCSTAPIAGTMDSIDSHHYDRGRRNEPQPPPGFYEPASRRSRVTDPPVDPPSAHADPYDMPARPVRRPKSFEPKDKIDRTPAAPATRTRELPSDRDPDRNRDRDRVLPPPPLPASDERDDF